MQVRKRARPIVPFLFVLAEPRSHSPPAGLSQDRDIGNRLSSDPFMHQQAHLLRPSTRTPASRYGHRAARAVLPQFCQLLLHRPKAVAAFPYVLFRIRYPQSGSFSGSWIIGSPFRPTSPTQPPCVVCPFSHAASTRTHVYPSICHASNVRRLNPAPAVEPSSNCRVMHRHRLETAGRLRRILLCVECATTTSAGPGTRQSIPPLRLLSIHKLRIRLLNMRAVFSICLTITTASVAPPSIQMAH